MLARSWFDAVKSRFTQAPVRRQRRAAGQHGPAVRRLRLETLEDRRVLAFDLAVDYPAGASPQAIVSADFNNDTVLDLAVANAYDVSILLGNPDGTFQPAQTAASGTYPLSLAVGDFNADGKPDLATGGNYGVTVLLGDGLGAFEGTAYISLSQASVAVGDFNGDGKLDLGVTSNVWSSGYDYGSWTGNASVLLGDGDGSFAGPNTTALGYGQHLSAAVADFNGDGKQDFATANSESESVSVLLGDGNGNLNGLTEFAAGYYHWSVAAGDVNGDLKTDLVTSNRYADDVSVLLGNGLGGFGAAQNYAVGSGPTSIVLGDFNHDAKIDIATANFYSNDVSVLRGSGDGTFVPALNFATGPGDYALAAGDFNGDGWLDAATANTYGDNASVLINNQFWPSVSINDVTVTEGNTGTVNATFTLTLLAASDVEVTVHYQTVDGEASVGSDYTAAWGDVTFAPGETSKTVSVLVIGDRLAEYYESFFVNLSNPTNALVPYVTGVCIILDDEPYLGIVEYVNGVEGNSGTTPFTFTVTLSAAYDAPVTVNYATANRSATAGSDYQAATGTLTIPAGQTSGTITVPVIADRVPEQQEYFVVNLTGAPSAHLSNLYSYATIGDDEPRITMNSSVSLTEGNSGTQVMTFTVMLFAPYDQAVTFNFATADGTAKVSDNDYVATSGTMTFAPGETTKTINVMIKGDTKKETDEYFSLQLSGASSNALFWSLYTGEFTSHATGRGNILNDDLAPGKKR